MNQASIFVLSHRLICHGAFSHHSTNRGGYVVLFHIDCPTCGRQTEIRVDMEQDGPDFLAYWRELFSV